jgi:transcriptional regulator with XRE-family HTH domain
MSAREFGQVLKALREQAGLSQIELAKRLGIYQSSITRWERGQGEPGVSLVKPLATILGVDVNTLLDWPAAKPSRKQGKK